MNHQYRWMATTAALTFILAAVGDAHANLCKEKHVKSRHTTAGKLAQSEAFGSGAYAGDDGYNARVLGCNRKRDTRGKAIEKAIKANHNFAGDLGLRIVKGKINYLGAFPVRYGYGLERKKTNWTLTAPIEFHWPKRHGKRLDLPMQLATELGIVAEHCSSTTKKLGKIDLGFVETIKKKRQDDMRDAGWTDSSIEARVQAVGACRVKRTMKVDGLSVKTHLMKFWQREIEQFWTHAGFTVKTPIVNLKELSSSSEKSYRKGKAIWPIRLNHKQYSRATYKAIIGKPAPLYAGLPQDTIVHEFGHWIGLDDEYPEAKRNVKCKEIGGSDYVMCSSPYGVSSTTAKGIYAWITTRRYVVGKDMPVECKKDSQCQSTQYCYTGVGRDVCKDKKPNGKPCLKAKVCQSGRCAGGLCAKADECTKDSHCKSNQYCRTGPGRNKCKAKKSDGKGCTKDKHCKSDNCTVLFCRHKNHCRSNGDCSSGKYCDKGKLGTADNRCRTKKAKGKSCKKNKECRSGKCKRKKCT